MWELEKKKKIINNNIKNNILSHYENMPIQIYWKYYH